MSDSLNDPRPFSTGFPPHDDRGLTTQTFLKRVWGGGKARRPLRLWFWRVYALENVWELGEPTPDSN